MTREAWLDLKRAFADALALDAPARRAFLDRLRTERPDLAGELHALLETCAREDGSLTGAVGAAAAQISADARVPLIGRQIGAYRIVAHLAQGGMGDVYAGERADGSFDQRVAVKLIGNAGLSPDAGRRFRTERQILAKLSHPNIARILDGGTTENGVAYLVMEFVEGVPIDVFCAERRLSLRRRLKLFGDVCAAVEYAHQNLIVHRDIKPSNILVTADATPKLLDFGIAKMLDTSSGPELATVDGQRLLTPDYASPEQLRGQPVSTASDVYSLGVLLYRLICGRSPYRARRDLPSALMRAIIEEAPAKPSWAVTTRAGEESSAEALARERDSNSARLRRQLRGDLDTIALTALRKEPERRYASARALHEDIERYLANKPIAARSDRMGYVARKFVRRHWVGVAATVAFCVLLIASAAQIVVQRNRAQAQAATAARMSQFLVSMLESSNPYERSPDVDARALLDRGARQIDAELADAPLVAARLKTTMAKAYSSLGLQSTAAELAAAAVDTLSGLGDTGLDHANALATLASIKYEQQDYNAAKRFVESALSLYADSRMDATTQIALAEVTLSRVLMRLDAPDEMLRVAREAVEMLHRAYGDEDANTNAALGNLATIYNELGDYEHARPLAEQVVHWSEKTYGDVDLLLAAPLHSLGQIVWNQGDFKTADKIYRRELAILESSLGKNHPSLHTVLVALASTQRKLGFESDAKAYYERAIRVLEQSESPPLGELADTYGDLGTLLMDGGYLDDAEPLIRRALELTEQVYGKGNAGTEFRLMHLGVLYRKRGDYDQARGYFQQAIDAALNRYPEIHRNVQIMRLQYGVNEGAAGNYARGREILERVLYSLETNQGPSHPLVGQTLIELAQIDVDSGDYEQAEQRLVRSLAIYHALRDETHPDIELIFRLRAQAAAGLGRTKEAQSFTAEADRLLAARQKVTAAEAEASQNAKF